ncbi:uncharacterized protein L969DRAFT_42303 [Mixia osmundae IAM 14324]|uniref:Cation/H+ exchanger transmembrane domain-containing protein n=1 Tax=Mixia osmundae (strain CBS 9802 / IAM 14324 / JCM 22182 / KY 12970) TaxID=764103 RepID=G7DTL9_MIXOS|nr:uncharacterized protein L969DRAFT_42303 [Mixia osmundae IAM 14324]KEI42797.1 hypothetical protein L969DRAFT_42303 [Mixia osmundae IAM 14324]GAA93866.1 hypothetical protein E5Q_00512 [Mixia osmundae IAM 14324]
MFQATSPAANDMGDQSMRRRAAYTGSHYTTIIKGRSACPSHWPDESDKTGALSSTSLGTTLTALGASGLTETRIGSVLQSAALIDDVIALILLQLVLALPPSVSGYGHEHDNNLTEIILRPPGVSVGMLLCSYTITRWPLAWLARRAEAKARLQSDHSIRRTKLVLMLARRAFFAGLALSYLDIRPHMRTTRSFAATSEELVSQVQSYLWLPLFFASIGFAIPVREIFSGEIVLNGVLYASVCCIDKAIVGIWVVISHARRALSVRHLRERDDAKRRQIRDTSYSHGSPAQAVREAPTVDEAKANGATGEASASNNTDQASPGVTPSSSKEMSFWLPTALLASAMIARGESGATHRPSSASSGCYRVLTFSHNQLIHTAQHTTAVYPRGHTKQTVINVALPSLSASLLSHRVITLAQGPRR